MTLDEPAVHQRYYFIAQSWRMENINSSDSQFRTTCHQPLYWKTFIQYPPKLFQSVVRKVKCRDRFEGLDTASFGNLQKSPEYVRHCLRKCGQNAHESLPPLTQEKRAVFSCVIRLFRNEKRILLEKKFDPRLFLGLLLGSHWSTIGQSFSLSLVTIPELFAKVNSAEFPCSFVSPV